ncbi:MAG: Hpt domain-containing protein [Spirochaetia bacterium]|nr:Hpt domain-containing protein [Spirochaetia bacterium]
MEEKLNKLKNWGCDINGALDRFLNDKDLYYECLSMFVEDQNFAALKLHINDANQKKPFSYVHTLKGVAGNLGISPLFESLSELCEALRNNEYDPNSGLFERTVVDYNIFLEIMK